MAIDSQYIGSTFHATGSVVAPASGAQIAGITTPAKGFWKIVVKYGFGGTAETANVNNFFLSVNGGMYQGSSLCHPLGPANTMYEVTFERVFLNGVNNVSIMPNNNASAGAVYITEVIITQLQN